MELWPGAAPGPEWDSVDELGKCVCATRVVKRSSSPVLGRRDVGRGLESRAVVCYSKGGYLQSQSSVVPEEEVKRTASTMKMKQVETDPPSGLASLKQPCLELLSLALSPV